MKKFTADFETTTDPNDCRVWAFAISEIGNIDNFIYGNSLDDFMDFCANKKENYKMWFHNLKFDGEFIVWWLLDNGFEFVPDKENRKDKSFTTLVSDMGQWYMIEVFFKVSGSKVNKVMFYDSMKLLNTSVEQVAKDFDLPISKLKIDYRAYRAKGHVLTDEEVAYIRNDVEIMSMALDFLFKHGVDKMTIAGNALADFKRRCTNFRTYFPVLPKEVDRFCRASYKGGFTWLSPLYIEKEVGKGVVFDVNSMHPAQMKYKPMPIGYPEAFEGEYIFDPLYPLYIVAFACSFKLKEGKIPSIQLKHSLSYMPNEYIETTNGEIVTLTLTTPDFELFFENYEVEDIEWFGGYKFKSCNGLFTNYVDYWTEQKIKSKREGNKSMTALSKLYLNSLYGRFGLNGQGDKKEPVLIDGVLHQVRLKTEDRENVYCPVASFITAYSRKLIIETAEAMRHYTLEKYGFDGMIYTDTDSCHVTGIDESDYEELGKYIEIDDYKLGAWKPESIFVRGKYLRQKCYMEQWPDGSVNVTVAGLPKKLSHLVNFDNFKVGFTTADFSDAEIGEKGRKFTYLHVRGGVILEDTDFTIK